MKRPKNPTEFGKRLREARIARGWSQADLAARMGITAGWVGLVETGARGKEPQRDLVVRVSQVLKDPLDPWLEVAGLKDADRPSVAAALPPFRDFVERLPELTADQKRTLIVLYGSFVPTAESAKPRAARVRRKS